MARHANSAQSEWLKHPHVTWRSAFPLFASLGDALSSLLWHETRMLVLTAAGLTALTFGFVLTLAFYDPNWASPSWARAAQAWTLAAVAVVGVWTSLGRGDWHFRFPLGALAAAWIAVVHVAAEAAVTNRHWTAELWTMALSTFGVSAFGGAWLRSLGRWELVGPRPGEPATQLRRFQFSTATLLRGMMLTAAVLGLWQVVAGLDGRIYVKAFFLQTSEAQAAIALASISALAAFLVMFGGLKRAMVAAVLIVALLAAVEYFRYTGGASPLRGTTFSRIPLGVMASVAISLAFALLPLAGLRLAGFRLQTVRP